MKEIGGYIELWENTGSLFHEDAVALNTARGCLAYLIETKNIKKIALPRFLCNSVTKLCQALGVEIQFYNIDESFLPSSPVLRAGEWLYIVNTYGQLNHADICRLREMYGRIIVDNVQAYFEEPVEEIDTLYSCRKFFGVPDGAFLYTDAKLDRKLEQDESRGRMEHLLGRYERDASSFYDKYVESESSLEALPIKRMSKLTENLLRGVDYGYAKRRRNENFMYLHKRLESVNRLHLRKTDGAFAYPLLIDDGAQIRKKLIAEKIYIPTLWPNVLNETDAGMLEHYYAENILPLPCDQRYGEVEMHVICKQIMGQ